jgi:hypothetical protein
MLDTAVGIVNRLQAIRLKGSGFDCRQGQKIYLVSKTSIWALRPTQSPVLWMIGSFPNLYYLHMPSWHIQRQLYVYLIIGLSTSIHKNSERKTLRLVITNNNRLWLSSCKFGVFMVEQWTRNHFCLSVSKVAIRMEKLYRTWDMGLIFLHVCSLPWVTFDLRPINKQKCV